MQKEWIPYPLEDCLEHVPKTTKIPSSDYKESGRFPIVSQEETLISGYWDNEADVLSITHPVVVFGDHTRVLKYVDFNFVVGADGVKVLSPKNSVNPKFLFYFLKWYKVPSLGYSRHFKLLKEANIPVPPLSMQLRIVAELDLLSGIVEKQDAQLKELDALAQSIFYDMFGNPAENDKGWTIKSLGDVCLIERGGSPRPIEQYLTDDENGVNWIKIGDATDGGMVISSTKQKIIPEGVKKSRFVHRGDFLLSNSMSFGKPYILGVDGCIHDGWLVIRDSHNTFNKIYLYYFLGCPHTYESFKRMAVGGVVNNLNKDMVKKVRVAIPDSGTQDSFASKIEVIEQQKARIIRAIAETQNLLDYTMDKYFG